MTNPNDLQDVQGPWYTQGRVPSDTELARVVASNKAWTFREGDDRLRDSSGRAIAPDIDEAAKRMRALGWFSDNGDVLFALVPADSDEAASALRSKVPPN